VRLARAGDAAPVAAVAVFAAARRLPFLPVRVGLGSGVLWVNPDLRTVRSPYVNGGELTAVPALRPDAANR
jgi:glutaconate CoA-transferase, subunit A